MEVGARNRLDMAATFHVNAFVDHAEHLPVKWNNVALCNSKNSCGTLECDRPSNDIVLNGEATHIGHGWSQMQRYIMVQGIVFQK